MNVIKFPNYTNNYSSKWSVYEKSYLNPNYIDEYEIDDSDINLYVEEYEKIIKIRNNFFKMDENVVLSKLLINLNNKFIERYSDNFGNIIVDFIKAEKINKFAYCFLKTLKYDKDRILIITNYINNNFIDINFINNLKIINQIILEFEKIKDMNEVICLIHKNISNNITTKFLNFILNTDLNILSNLLKKINLFKKFYNYFDLSKKVIINKAILEKIILNLNNKNISDNNLANTIINIFDFFKSNDLNEVIDVECNLLLDYINASIYYWILDNNYLNIESLIIYSWNFLPKLNFLEYYKFHLQNRALIIKNYELEKKLFDKIMKIFNGDEFSNIIYEIKYILDDIYLSNLCNTELKNINVNVKYSFKDVDFDLSKCNLLICSNNLWNDNKNLYNTINYVDSIGVYECIINKFYESKYSKKRRLNISNEESIININLWKNSLIMPLTYYNLLYMIGDSEIETSKNTFNYLRDSLNYGDDYLKKIINIFKSKNLIREVVVLNKDELNNYINMYYEKSNFKNIEFISNSNLECNNLDNIKHIIFSYISFNNLEIIENCYKLNRVLIDILNIEDDIIFIINEELENQELYLNLVSVRKNEKRVLDLIEYDKDILLDSKICELLKKNKELKYGKFLLNLRHNISKFFIPSDKEILNRLERLIILGYVKKDNDLYKYVE